MPEAVFCRKISLVKINILRPGYTLTGNVYQLVIPMDIGEMIPADDSLRLLSAVLERIDYRKSHAAYSRQGRIGRSPESLFKVLVYGYTNGVYSSCSQYSAINFNPAGDCPSGPSAYNVSGSRSTLPGLHKQANNIHRPSHPKYFMTLQTDDGGFRPSEYESVDQ
jgi:hypothetical protein